MHGHLAKFSVYLLLQSAGQTVSPGGHADIHLIRIYSELETMLRYYKL